MKTVRVLQFISPTGLYGAEMWILALAKSLDPTRVHCSLAVTKESAEQDLTLFDRYIKLGLDAHKISMNGRFDLRSVVRLKSLMLDEQIDVLHTHGYKSDILGLLSARLAGVKTVATPHGFENVKDIKLRVFMRLGCLALRHFDRVAPLSDELMTDMRRIGVLPQKTRLIRNGVDLEEIYSAKNRVSPPVFTANNEMKIGYVGQIAFRKNLDAMIDVFDLFYRDHKNVRLIIIGEGNMCVELQERAKQLASGDRIDFLGYRNDRLRFVKEMDLFCMTSSLEGIPRCMMEAMAMGVPVAAFDIPGVDKLIKHEKTGLLAPFGDIEALKKCWERILFNVDLKDRLGKNGKKHIEDNFSAKRMAVEYMDLYNDLASR